MVSFWKSENKYKWHPHKKMDINRMYYLIIVAILEKGMIIDLPEISFIVTHSDLKCGIPKIIL